MMGSVQGREKGKMVRARDIVEWQCLALGLPLVVRNGESYRGRRKRYKRGKDDVKGVKRCGNSGG